MDAPVRPDWQPAPKDLSPMLATLGQLAAGQGRRQWAYEMKWDGMRAIVRVDGGRLTLHSRNDRDVTVSFPEIRPLGEVFGTDQAVLDAEIVCFDEHGRPDFGRLQDRMHVTSAGQAQHLAKSRPVVLLAFDLLHHNGDSLLELPYSERRKRLEQAQAGRSGLADAGRLRRHRRRGGEDQPGTRAGGRDGQAADLDLSAGQADQGLGQGQEHPDPGGGDRRLDAGQGQSGRHHRCPAARDCRPRTGWPTSARSVPVSPNESWTISDPRLTRLGPQDLAVQPGRAARRCPGRALGHARAGR